MVVCWCVLILPVLILEGLEDRSEVPRSGLKRVRLRRKSPVHEVFTGLEETEAWGFMCWGR